MFTFGGWLLFRGFGLDSASATPFYRAKALSVEQYAERVDFDRNIIKTIYFTARMDEGPDKGKELSAMQEVGGAYAAQDKEVSAGDRIFVFYNATETGETQPQFSGYDRSLPLMLLCAGFFLAIVLIGRTKGVNTILSLAFTCLAIFLVYIPSILSGVNVYLSTVVVGIYIILMSLLLINGANAKTLCAVLGNIGGVVAAAALAGFMHYIMKMTGFASDESMMLSLSERAVPLDLLGIGWGGMVLGSLGAIMDVAMSIASSMHELGEHMAQKSFTKMFRSGMNIGRDAIGTMTNTLILAYIGSSLALVLLLILNSTNTAFLFSTEMIAAEIVQAITGSMGILVAVPFTALFSAYVYCK
jgi:uncharacterized membrane protein